MADGVDVKSLRTPGSTEEVGDTPSVASIRDSRYLLCVAGDCLSHTVENGQVHRQLGSAAAFAIQEQILFMHWRIA